MIRRHKKRIKCIVAALLSCNMLAGCIASNVAGGDLADSEGGKSLEAFVQAGAEVIATGPAADGESTDLSNEGEANDTSQENLEGESNSHSGSSEVSGESSSESRTSEEVITTTEDEKAGLTAVAQVEQWVNVRVLPTTESGIVGKIYNNCAATILDEVEGEDGLWYYMSSGNVTGYIKAEFFVIGEEAEALKDEIGLTFGTVIVENLRIRSTPDLSTEDNIISLIPMGTDVYIISHDDEWAQIKADAYNIGYVHVSCLKLRTEFDVAITLEEEAAQIAAREAAEQAAKEAEEFYLALLASQEAQSLEEASRAEAAAQASREAEEAASREEESRQQAEANQTQPEVPPATQPQPTETLPVETSASEQPAQPVSPSDLNTALRNAITAFALQFEGCPYVHAGNSLTNGTDCSGFTMLVYQNFGYSIARTPSGQAGQGRRIDLSEVKPGDLVFYTRADGSIGHVALYIGNGKIIHAATEEYGICIWEMYYRQPCAAVSIID